MFARCFPSSSSSSFLAVLSSSVSFTPFELSSSSFPCEPSQRFPFRIFFFFFPPCPSHQVGQNSPLPLLLNHCLDLLVLSLQFLLSFPFIAFITSYFTPLFSPSISVHFLFFCYDVYLPCFVVAYLSFFFFYAYS